MEIDPEVAALMDDLPATKLPPALEEAGWGQFDMDTVLGKAWDKSARLKKPSQEFQPKFDHCVQCGLPIAKSNRGWMDHVGGQECDGAIVDEKEFDLHVTKADIEEVRAHKKAHDQSLAEWAKREQERLHKEAKRKSKQDKLRKTPGACGANRNTGRCQHQCSQGWDHFGFHECKFCKHLWK